jgi:hypothetical protein
MTPERCAHCPADPGDVCVRWTTGHVRLCELAETDEHYRRLIRERSGGEPPKPTRSSKPRIDIRDLKRMSKR